MQKRYLIPALVLLAVVAASAFRLVSAADPGSQ